MSQGSPTFELPGQSEEIKVGLGSVGAFPVRNHRLRHRGCRWAARPATPSTRPRDLGPRIAHALLPIPGKRDSDWSYSWIPVAGPVLGGLLAALLYQLFRRRRPGRLTSPRSSARQSIPIERVADRL